MTGNHAYLDYLEDIIDASEKAQRFVGGMDLEAFERDEKTAFAVMRALEIIGEATKKIPEEIRLRHVRVPWRSMAGNRRKSGEPWVMRPLGSDSCLLTE